MIVDNVWKLTNTVRVGLDARSSHAQRQSSFPDNVCFCCPPCHGVSHYENSKKNRLLSCFFSKTISIPRAKIVKRNDKTNTGEGVKGKKGSTVSDEAGGKSLSDTSTSAGVKSTVIRTSVNIFEASGRLLDTTMIDLMWAKQAP